MSESGSKPPPPGRALPAWETALLAAVIFYGTALRAWDLGATPFWVDEAESAINALTILQHGLPVDHYLDQPICENTLLRPWPEHPEYEFKDVSYSDRGLDVYHGWLPLYAIAASFALCDVKPDDDPAALGVRHSAEELRRRTWAGRLPGVLFGGVFLLAVFAAGRELYGREAAWAAVAAAAVCTPAVEFARQARYYSPTLALAACCALLLALMLRRGRWRDFLFGAVALVLLFHTHIVSSLAVGAAGALAAPRLARHPRGAARLAAFAAVVATGTVSWVVFTGFAAATAHHPRARSLLTATDLRDFVAALGPFPPLAALTVAWLLAGRPLRGRLPDRLLRPFADHAGAFLLLAAWAVIGLFAFVLGAPAVSYFYGRLVLTVFVPGLLFGALLCAAAARALAPRHACLLAPALLVGLLAAAGQARFWPASPGDSNAFDIVEELRAWDWRPGTRVYATPNHHLLLTFYCGMPVQSVAPVRKSFLDAYAGPILIVEAGPRYEPLTGDEIRQALAAAGRFLSDAEAREWERRLTSHLTRAELCGRVAEVRPGPEALSADFDALPALQRRKTAQMVAAWVRTTGNPMFKGYSPADNHWWQIFYYRFVNPEARTGAGLNYADRVRDARAHVLPQGWVFYDCPARKAALRQSMREPGPSEQEADGSDCNR